MREGDKHVTIPLAPRTSRAIDLYIGERATGPIFLGAEGDRMDRWHLPMTDMGVGNAPPRRSPGGSSTLVVVGAGNPLTSCRVLADTEVSLLPLPSSTPSGLG